MQPRIDFSNKADSVLDCYPSNALKPLMVVRVCFVFFLLRSDCTGSTRTNGFENASETFGFTG